MAHERDIQFLTDDLVRSLIASAGQSPRRRMNHNFHAGPQDNPHRFLNVFLEGTYIAPHRHLSPPKSEMFVVLEGAVALFCFDDDGTVRSRHLLGRGHPAWGIDLAPGVWHTLTAVTPHALCLEVKPGPWDPASDKEFAPWAPGEGDPGAVEYLRKLLAGAGK
jgi:cupin fold WbuC family metalloprotein